MNKTGSKFRNVQFSIAICTYNRASILQLCLDHIEVALQYYGLSIETMVIDNNSSDDTKKVVLDSSESHKNSNIKYILETKYGISSARNAAIKEAGSNWLCYIDDDMFIRKDFFKAIENTIVNYHFDCFGGMYYSKWLNPKPHWLHSEFGQRNIPFKGIGTLSKDFNHGCLMVFHKNVFNQIQGFSEDLGMKKNLVGYSEEKEFQLKMRQLKMSIGFNSNLVGDHVIGIHKYQLKWHIASAYLMQRDDGKISNASIPHLFLEVIKALFLIPIRIIKSLYHLINSKDYYYQNLILDSLTPILRATGFLIGRLNPL